MESETSLLVTRKAAQAPLSGLAGVVARPSPPARLDVVDLRLLQLLVADARISQRALARQLGMSPPAIGERIARLERAGVIRGYTVDLDWSALGYTTQVHLAVTANTDRASILTALHAIPEVEDIAVVTGSMDLLARVRVRDHAHLRELLFERIWRIGGVERTETFLSLAQMPSKDFAGSLLSTMDLGESSLREAGA